MSAVFFGFVVLSYVEGASLHQERGGATIIARYAFNELWSFIAGWAILLDYILLIALTAFATTDYVAVLFPPLGGRASPSSFGAAVVAGVAWLNIRGAGSKRYERFSFVVLGDLVLQTTIVILGLARLLNPDVLTHPMSIAGMPSTSDLIFAFTLDARDVRRASTRRRAWPARSRSAAAGSSAWSPLGAGVHPATSASRSWRSACSPSTT